MVKKHSFPYTAAEAGWDTSPLYENVYELKNWVKAADKFAKENTSSNEAANTMRGNLFEHFVEKIIEHREGDPRIGCTDIAAFPPGETGIDLIGKRASGRNHLHQCKFTAKTRYQLGVAEDKLGITHRSTMKYEPEMLTLWTTARSVSPQATEMFDYDGAQIFLYENIYKFVNGDGGDGDFWSHYRQSFRDAVAQHKSFFPDNEEDVINEPDTGLIASGEIELRDYQQEALKVFAERIEEEGRLKGRYVYPTGSGKTLIESLIMKHQMKRKGAGMHLVAAPRIALISQLMREYRKFIGKGYSAIGFHSGSEREDDPRDHYDGRTQRSTTEIGEVEFQMRRAERSGLPMILFSTYHSLHKLVDRGFHFETFIADESQYCISERYFEEVQKVDARAKLFFTATERHGIGKHADDDRRRSNDNEMVFGKILGSENIDRLVERGWLTQPVLHILYGYREFDADTIVEETKFIAEKQGELVASNVPEGKRMPSKTLFACKRATDVTTVVHNMEELLTEVPDCKIFTINARDGAKVNGQKRKRREFIEEINTHDGDAMVFHYDILSEGIDVEGITGVAILREMNQTKALQTIGRCMRTLKEDREKPVEERTKKWSYVSVPAIDGDLKKSRELNAILEAMVNGDMNLNADEIVVQIARERDPDIITKPEEDEYGREPDDQKEGRDDNEDDEDDEEQIEIDLLVEQTRLLRVKHEVREYVMDAVKDIEDKIERDHEEALRSVLFSSHLIYQIASGKR